MDMDNSSQDIVASMGMLNRDHNFVHGPNEAVRKPLGDVDFMCGLDHDSSQSSLGSTVACKKRKRPRLVINDDMLQGLAGDVNDNCESSSDSELPDIKL